MRDAHPLEGGSPVSPEKLELTYRDFQPLPFGGQPRFIAEAALWLASDAAEFVTGQDIAVDGGLSIVGDARSRVPVDLASGMLLPGR